MSVIQEAIMTEKQTIGLRLELAQERQEPDDLERAQQAVEAALEKDDAYYAAQPWRQAWEDLRTWFDERRKHQRCVLVQEEALAVIQGFMPTCSAQEGKLDYDWQIRFETFIERIKKTTSPLDVRPLFMRMRRLDMSVENGMFKTDKPIV
jgi:hypothetical protein